MIKLNNLHAQYLSIKAEIDAAIESVIVESAFIGGKAVETFEHNFAEYVGARHCIGVGNGTDALEIIFEALEVRHHGVIMPALTAAPTVEAVVRTGNHPIFVDVDEAGLMDLNEAAKMDALPDVVFLPVHLYGTPVNMPQLLSLAHGRLVIEDCAQAHGARLHKQHVGTFGVAGAFSFYPSKNLGAWGDAGAIVTNDDALAEKCRAIRNHGRQGKFDHSIVGRNSRMDGLQAAILNAKLPYLDSWNAARRYNAMRYTQHLAQWTLELRDSVYHQFPLLVDNRQEVRRALKERGIATGLHYPFVLPDLLPYKQEGHFDQARLFAEHELSIPVHEMLTEAEVAAVITALKEVLRDA